jgi:hypothetical protein
MSAVVNRIVGLAKCVGHLPSDLCWPAGGAIATVPERLCWGPGQAATRSLIIPAGSAIFDGSPVRPGGRPWSGKGVHAMISSIDLAEDARCGFVGADYVHLKWSDDMLSAGAFPKEIGREW